MNKLKRFRFYFNLIFTMLMGFTWISDLQAGGGPAGGGGASLTTNQLTGGIHTLTTAVPFLMIAPDARAGGMGDVGCATSPDVNSLAWNTSKLAFINDKMGFAVSYVPWLRTLVPDINLAYLSGFYKLDKNQVITGALRYFSLGDITFTDVVGNTIGQFRPNEFSLDAGYARKLGENFSGGFTGRYIYSNLTDGVSVQGADTHAGTSFAVDLSGYYQNTKLKIGDKKDNTISAGLNISNIGAKIAYSSSSERDFLPANLRLGPALKMNLDEYNTLTIAIDANKLLVPTMPIYATGPLGGPIIGTNGRPVILAGQDPNIGVPAAIIGSFSDAPGGWKEEIQEINYSVGLEYWYDKQFAARLGYFYEYPNFGNRQFFTFGAGLKYNVFALDFAYLVPTDQTNPLQNTLYFTLFFNFDALKSKDSESKPAE